MTRCSTGTGITSAFLITKRRGSGILASERWISPAGERPAHIRVCGAPSRRLPRRGPDKKVTGRNAMSIFRLASAGTSVFRGMRLVLALVAILAAGGGAVMAADTQPQSPAPTAAATTAATAAASTAASGSATVSTNAAAAFSFGFGSPAPAPAPAAEAAPAPAGAAPGATAAPPRTQSAMSMPTMGPYVPPSLVEPVSVAACRQCREGCFRDYGGPCADEACARALPLCMRNCWYAVCR